MSLKGQHVQFKHVDKACIVKLSCQHRPSDVHSISFIISCVKPFKSRISNVLQDS